MTDRSFVELPYCADSSQLAARLRHLACPVFLDSCQQKSQGGRYDILSALPLATIRVELGILACSIPLPPVSARDLFEAADFLMKHFAPEPQFSRFEADDEVPFDGGLLGFLGYPRLTGHGIWQIEQAFLGLYPWALTVDHLRQRCRLQFRSNCPDSTRLLVLEALRANPAPQAEFELRHPFENNMARSWYDRTFDRIKAYIDAGDCYQVNLAQRFSSAFNGDPFTAYCRLRRATGKPFSAFLAWDDKALLSLSPERFLRVQDRQVTTQPIKGTRPRGRTPAEDRQLARELLASEKDRAENLMIVDLLRNDLGTVCEYGSVQVDKLFELKAFDNVYHLVSTIKGKLRDSESALRLLKHCFPGGSITGAPKIRAMEIIEELEPHRRQAYCGTVLFLGFNGNMDSNLTIRSLLCQADEIFCWAGGGIVMDSEPDQEYTECFDKVSSIFNSLEN